MLAGPKNTHIWIHLPLLIFGTLSFIGGVLSLTLPETLNRKLPETIEEGEAFGRESGDIEEQSPVVNSVKVESVEAELVSKEGDAESKLLQNGAAAT